MAGQPWATTGATAVGDYGRQPVPHGRSARSPPRLPDARAQGVNVMRAQTKRPLAPKGENGLKRRVPPKLSGLFTVMRSG